MTNVVRTARIRNVESFLCVDKEKDDKCGAMEQPYTRFILLISVTYMPTLKDYPGVSRIRNEFPGLPYESPHLPDKSDFGSFPHSCLF